jgi:hypothetical protein
MMGFFYFRFVFTLYEEYIIIIIFIKLWISKPKYKYLRLIILYRFQYLTVFHSLKSKNYKTAILEIF